MNEAAQYFWDKKVGKNCWGYGTAEEDDGKVYKSIFINNSESYDTEEEKEDYTTILVNQITFIKDAGDCNVVVNI
jgi:hypothetical protein